jgi:dephospho-CoA kinase
MNNPLHVGLTGGIGAGKSTVASIFRLMGIPVYDADSRAKQLMEFDENLVIKIKSEFGKESYKKDKLNRKYLAQEVFADNNRIEKLNALVHPVVAKDFDYWTRDQHSAYILKEAALLFENGSFRQLDDTILVISPLELRIKRLKSRDPERTDDQINSIIRKQMDVDEAKQNTNLYIINDQQLHLIPQVLEIHKFLKEKSLAR